MSLSVNHFPEAVPLRYKHVRPGDPRLSGRNYTAQQFLLSLLIPLHPMSRQKITAGGRVRGSFILASAFAAAGALAACGSTTPSAPAEAPVVSADTWAVVDGREITRDVVEKAYRQTSDVSQQLSEEETLSAKLAILNDLIIQDLLAAKARELKIEIPESEVDSAFAEGRKNVPDEQFQQELSRRNLSAADMREALRRELISNKVVEQEIRSKIAVTDQEITDFFNANRAQFNLAEEAYRVGQIVITPVADAQLTNRTGDDATTAEAATAKLEMLMGRLKAGAAFGDLAMDYSEDPESAPRGGDLGLVPMSRLKQAPAALRDAVLKVAPGTVNVVSSGGGHIIVLVLAHEQAGQRDLSMPTVKENITEALRGRKEQLLRTAYLTTVRSDARVENYLARRLVQSQGKLPTLAPAQPAAK